MSTASTRTVASSWPAASPWSSTSPNRGGEPAQAVSTSPIHSASGSQGSTGSLIACPGMLTTWGPYAAASACRTDAAAAAPTRTAASTLHAPMRGVTTTWPSVASSPAAVREARSRAAAATRPSFSAAYSSAASKTSSCETLITRTPGFTRRSASKPISRWVCAVLGTCRIRTSAVARSSSSGRRRVPSSAACSAVTYGSYATTPMPNTAMRRATSAPTRPSPIAPRTLPSGSTPA